jgi:hypothetical protein
MSSAPRRPTRLLRDSEDASDGEDDVDEPEIAEKEKVELPGFSEFEAASRASNVDTRIAVGFTR